MSVFRYRAAQGSNDSHRTMHELSAATRRYFINLSMASPRSFTASISPAATASTMQC